MAQTGLLLGQNRVLYLLLALVDEELAYDNWHPEKAAVLIEARRAIMWRLKHQQRWPADWPDLERYPMGE